MTNYNKEFKKFFNAMADEMRRNNSEKGDTWKKDSIVVGIIGFNPDEGISKTTEIPTEGYLIGKMQNCITNFLRNNAFKTNSGEVAKSNEELVNVANYCAMIWLRRMNKK